jgi:phage terminase large subunit
VRQLRVQIPEALEFLWQPSRYKVAYGGRDGAKSWNIARTLITKAYANPLRILCARELQNSIKDSVHRLLSDQIAALGMSAAFDVQATSIKGRNGSEFLFEGLRYNVDKIKSLEGIDICWVEEAANVSKNRWSVLIPTIRKTGSEIWVSFNPLLETDETYKRFVKHPPPDCIVRKVTYKDNPWLNQVMRSEIEHLRATDPDGYLHVYEGNCRVTLEGAIYANELRQAVTENRITRVPYDEAQPVHTFWDLGFADCTSIWFAQRIGFEYRLIDFAQDRLRKLGHYLKLLQDKPYVYGNHYLPHDADNESLGAESIAKTMRRLGHKVIVVPRPQAKSLDLKACREIFSLCWFDEERCDDGIQALRHYRYEVDEYGKWSPNPAHDENSHAADAFAQFARSISRKFDNPHVKQEVQVVTYTKDEATQAWLG